MSTHDLAAVLETLHRTASAMAADPRPPARIRLSAGGATLEWDLVPVAAAWVPGVGMLPAGAVPAAGLVVPGAVDPVGSVVPGAGLSGAPVVPPAPASPNGTGPAPALPAAPPATGGGVAAPATHTLTAPTVGVFYRSPEPGAPPFVDTGDLVTAGQQVGIVEAMKLMIPVEADRGGRVAEVLCADATAVEFGAPLFALAEG